MSVLEYFAGERREMLLILAISLVFSAAALGLFLSARTGFALAFMTTVMLCAGLLSAGVVSLMIRDKEKPGLLSLALQTEQHATTIAGEKERISVVLSKYKYYRYGAALIAVLAVAGLLISNRGSVHGVAAGLLLLVVAQVLIDHFSERRAHIYFERLMTL